MQTVLCKINGQWKFEIKFLPLALTLFECKVPEKEEENIWRTYFYWIMADVDELFSCFDDEAEEKQPTVPVVMEVDEKSLQEGEKS